MNDLFEPLSLPQTMFPRTRYFEVNSEKAGARYAIWITTPKSYELNPTRHYPVMYGPDGNRNASLSADAVDLCDWDLMDSFEPTIQANIGYTDEDAKRSLAVRARDLLPPKEHLPPMVEKGLDAAIANIDANSLLDREGMQLYAHNLRNPAGDRFLAFLTEELHPFVTASYRIDAERTALWGHSYGGLFATYAALQPTTIFRNIGASSPGIAGPQSVIFKLLADAAASGLSERSLHMTVAMREVIEPGQYQELVGAGTIEFLRRAASEPVKGLHVTSQFFEQETHITVKPQAFYSFLRKFYLRPREGAR